ncbi:hypothetical protein [Hanstruepera ponticola]|uniref:hypothetical protein n=1 Tax=Hanstruepera ponticola TaxID=2042995 RepID=UPI00177F1385|nr:hypothetical protein [Hanstruepera ponticola]
MNRFLTIISIVFICNNVTAQHKKQDTLKRVYMSLDSYKNQYKKPLTKNDSLNFMIRGNDTLVLVENYVRPNGISVPYEYKDSTFLKYYQKIAFRTKGIDSIDKKQTMRYWKDDIKIYFSESVSKKTRKNLMSFATKIANEVDSLNISEVKQIESSNCIIYYFGDYEYEPRLRNNKKSDYYISWNGNNQIYRSSIKIDTELYFNEKLIEQKLKELFIGTLGHFSRINNFGCESYFADCYSENKQLTPLDIELLQYHYSYGICKGTTLEKFEKQHQQAKELLKTHNRKMSFYHPL